MNKQFWKSRTLWLNVAAVGAHVAKQYLGIDAIPDVSPTVLAGLNFALRLITKQPLGL